MAEITLRLRFNLETGKKDIYIDFVSDDDSLPMEHEQDHREIVEDRVADDRQRVDVAVETGGLRFCHPLLQLLFSRVSLEPLIYAGW